MTLGTKKGDKVLTRAEGDEAEEAVSALMEFISSNENNRTWRSRGSGSK